MNKFEGKSTSSLNYESQTQKIHKETETETGEQTHGNPKNNFLVSFAFCLGWRPSLSGKSIAIQCVLL